MPNHGKLLAELPGISIRQSEVMGRFGDGCTDEEFDALPSSEVTNDWTRIPLEELERACVAHFDAEGYRYYIPALAFSVINAYVGTSMRVIGTISSLCPREPNRFFYLDKYRLLNSQQRFALAFFVEHLPSLVNVGLEEALELSQALSEYWTEFLSGPDVA
jgi:hypothetical protein